MSNKQSPRLTYTEPTIEYWIHQLNPNRGAGKIKPSAAEFRKNQALAANSNKNYDGVGQLHVKEIYNTFAGKPSNKRIRAQSNSKRIAGQNSLSLPDTNPEKSTTSKKPRRSIRKNPENNKETLF